MNRQVLQAIINVNGEAKLFCDLVLKEIQLAKDDNKQEIWIETPCGTILFVTFLLLKEILEEEKYVVETKKEKGECLIMINWKN